MHTKTMEGLVGARTNVNLMNTPVRVYKEARRKGDLETMERAMGYAGECSEKAKEYKDKADEGMRKDAEEARRIAKEQRAGAIRKRRDEREKQEKEIEENRNGDTKTDILEISEEGKVQAIPFQHESEGIPVPKDAYTSSRPNGLYRVGKDENGNPKVLYDDPKKPVAQSKIESQV